MFATLKNKIREEIGSDVSTVVRNAGSIRGISSRHVSQVNITLDVIVASALIEALIAERNKYKIFKFTSLNESFLFPS